MASLVCDISDITPSVMMRSTKYCEPSWTAAAYLQRQEKQKQCILQDIWFFFKFKLNFTHYILIFLVFKCHDYISHVLLCLNKSFPPPTLSQSLRRCIMLQFRKSNSNLRKMAFLITTVQSDVKWFGCVMPWHKGGGGDVFRQLLCLSFWKHTHYPFKLWLKIAAVSTESVCYDTYAVSFTMG